MKHLIIAALLAALATADPISSPDAESDPNFIKKIIVVQPYPIYPRHFWKRNAEADPTFKKKIIVVQPYPVYPRHFWKIND